MVCSMMALWPSRPIFRIWPWTTRKRVSVTENRVGAATGCALDTDGPSPASSSPAAARPTAQQRAADGLTTAACARPADRTSVLLRAQPPRWQQLKPQGSLQTASPPLRLCQAAEIGLA